MKNLQSERWKRSRAQVSGERGFRGLRNQEQTSETREQDHREPELLTQRKTMEIANGGNETGLVLSKLWLGIWTVRQEHQEESRCAEAPPPLLHYMSVKIYLYHDPSISPTLIHTLSDLLQIFPFQT